MSRSLLNGIIALIIVLGIVAASLYFVTVINQGNTPTETTPTTTGTPPAIGIVDPSDGATVSGLVNITFVADDEDGILSTEILIDGAVRANATTMIWNTTLENNGRHRIVCRATDIEGTPGEASVTVTVNNTRVVPETITEPIKVMTYNIWESGRDPDWKQVMFEENPDIVVLIETGRFDDSQDALLNRIVLEFNTHFSDELPYQGYTAEGIDYTTDGEAILSRYPILEFNQIPTVKLDDGSSYDVTHDFIEAVVRVNGTDIHVIGGHLKAMEGSNNQHRREVETEGIINYMDDLGDVPIIFLADMNSFSPDDTGGHAPPPTTVDLGYGPLTMMLRPDDPVYGQYSSKVHTFIDVFRTLNPDDPGYTYPEIGRIDYVIVNQHFAGLAINSTAGDTPHAATGSDHYSVDAFLKVPHQADHRPILASPNYSLILFPKSRPTPCQHPIGFPHVSEDETRYLSHTIIKCLPCFLAFRTGTSHE